MATEADVKRALTQIRPDETVVVKLKDGTEIDGHLVNTDGDTVRLGDEASEIALSDVESVVTVIESDGPE
jgi:small nuclear ribonucleoprotein (snRNP)-like protein